MRTLIIFDGDNFKHRVNDGPEYLKSLSQEDLEQRIRQSYGSTGAVFSPYRIEHGHGYTDEEIFRLIDQRIAWFDHLILVTNDKGFFMPMAELAANGWAATVIIFRYDMSRKSLRGLKPANYVYAEDLIAQ